MFAFFATFIFVIGAIFVFLVWISGRSNKKKQNRQNAIAVPCDNIVKTIPSFNASLASLCATVIGPNNAAIYVDKNSKKICLAKPNSTYKLYDGKDILDVEIKENNFIISKSTGSGKAIVGGLVFGVAGAVIGSASTKRIDSVQVDTLQLVIHTKDIENSTIMINYIVPSLPLPRNSPAYSDWMSVATIWHGMINVIMHDAP